MRRGLFITREQARVVAVSVLLATFVTVVVLPNEIGTHELPAVTGKAALTKASPRTVEPGRNGPPAALVLLQVTGISHCKNHLFGAQLDFAPIPALKRSLPLLT